MSGLSMSQQDAMISALDAIDATDPERAHGIADDILRDAAPEEVRQAYDRLVRRCEWWAAA